jgi:hypothetical protein
MACCIISACASLIGMCCAFVVHEARNVKPAMVSIPYWNDRSVRQEQNMQAAWDRCGNGACSGVNGPLSLRIGDSLIDTMGRRSNFSAGTSSMGGWR